MICLFLKGWQRYGTVSSFGFRVSGFGFGVSGSLTRNSKPGTRNSLVFCVVDLYPVAIGVLEINLFYIVNPDSNAVGFSRPVFIWDFFFFQNIYKIVDRCSSKTEMGVFRRSEDRTRVLDQVQVACIANSQPGVPAVVKGLRNCI